ncbi:MAG: ThiF family adenylyltransferase [Campylobacterales bacterium]|nr:ThiF family adenylyltransferase [Campylobacterales bacterium]
MNEFYLRQIALWGEEKQELLKDKRVLIIGSGGLGCSIAFALGSSGIGHFSFVDFDTVSSHNIHRQIAFEKSDVGKFKCEVLKSKILNRAVDVKIDCYIENFEQFSNRDLIFDLIIDATDNLAVRVLIDKYAKIKNTPWIYGSVEKFLGQVCFFDKASFDMFNIIDRKPEGIACPIVMFVASFQANLAIRYLVGLNVKKDLLNYIYMSDEGEFILQKFKV